MSSPPTVAIAGASGNLGASMAQVFLEPAFRARFTDVIVLARGNSAKIQQLVSKGARLRQYSEDKLEEALEGVDVLVNTVGPSGHKFKESLLRCLPRTAVRLYFPSEFGVNHYLHDFDHEEWNAKKHHFRLTSQLIPNIRVCRVYPGLFLEESIGPWFGFFTKQGKYEAIGSPAQPVTYTSMDDTGKALAVLASSPPAAVPAEVYLSGDSKSFAEIAKIMGEAGAGHIDVSRIPLNEYKAQVLSKPSPTPERYLRFLMAEGKIDHRSEGLGNHNHLVQGAGEVEAFKSMTDLAKETQGRPWVDSD
ncbi:nmrA-like family protein [Hirsutella rhossiliensis]|uniref:NmrA-like family domain-containing protein n=1 Tax=Hirsutella rhossiliensis TaxID=111463 RepID=A0A9P8N187_9HYPO|nr:nmrA-like family domain-containing protein [Hirsutella rhossiliensis]KAH0965803.1 nmrA-like family domain-containing protein [Hirsutella rhossiliensis]